MSTTTTFSVAAIQWELRQLADFAAFASLVRTQLDRANGADIVVFGELFTLNLLTTIPGWQALGPDQFARVGEYTGAYRDLFATEAARRGQVILAGSHLVGDPSESRNAAHLFQPDGTVTTHVKTHIFPLEAESNTREGDEITVVDLGFATVGIAICYEAEIPEISTILARRGAEIILCPSYTITPAGFWRVRHCAQTRCIENQVFFVHCSTVGHVGEPILDGLGQSSILSPCDTGFPANGVLAEARADEADVISAALDLGLLRENRRSGNAPTFEDRLRRGPFYRAHADDLLPAAVPPVASPS